MRLHYIVLLGVAALVAALVAVANATLVSNDAQETDFLARSATGLRAGAPIDRLLRTQSFTEKGGEERAFGIKSIPGADKISSLVTNQKLSRWLKKDKDTDAVFIKLKLNTAGKNVFENPKFLAWANYVDDFNRKHPDEAKSMLPTLLKQYGNVPLATMLEAAKQADSTYSVARRLQGEQMKLWRYAGLSTDELFKVYKLDDGVANLLAKPGVNIWIRYADEFNPGASTTLFDKLRATYSDTALSQLLIAAKKVPSTEKLATDLQNQQVRLWLDRLDPPEKVFKLLMLDKGADGLLANPQLQTWLRYAETYRSENPYARKVTLVDTLMGHYSDTALATMLKTATTTYSKRMAAVVEGDLLSRWAIKRKPLEYVTKMLGTSPAKEKLLKAAYLQKLQKIRSS